MNSKLLWNYLSFIGLAFLFARSLGSPMVQTGDYADNRLHKRAPEVILESHTFINNVLSGYINVQNIAFAKVVTVVYAVGNSWALNQQIRASYLVGTSVSGTEIWYFSGTAVGATQFYIRYDVNGVSYYDPGNNVNYQITPSATSTISTSTFAVAGVVTPTQPPPILVSNPPFEPAATALSGCGTFNGLDSCPSDSTYNAPDSAERRRWQTPPLGDAAYVGTFQSYRDLVGYADIQYNSARSSAAVVVNAGSRTGEVLTYSFNGVSQSSNVYQVPSSFASGLDIVVTTPSGKTLRLDTLYFTWQGNAISPPTGASFNGGQKGGIAELFGWPYDDVAKECAFLGKAGYMGVKVWPPTEHVWGSYYYEPDGQFRPWYLVYQPVSYRLHSRMGTRDQLRAMIQTCRANGVRVYADAVINHMTGQGNDIQNHRTDQCIYYSGHNATDGSPYFTSGNTFLVNPFTNTRPALEYPAVPYGPTDFHCERSLSSFTDGETITKGWLVGLADLNTEKAYVQDRIATYLVDLLSIGFSGFRIDAAKHIGPASTAQILGRFRQKMGGSMPGDFITWLEVLIGGEADLLACGGGEWSWYTNFDNQLKANGFSDTDVEKVKIWSSDYPTNFPVCGRWIIPPSRFAIQNDDHDQQAPGSSDMGDKGSVLVKDKDVGKHRFFEVQLFSRTDADWYIKLVLSSYVYMNAGGNGFPDGLSDCSLFTGTSPVSGCLGVPKDTAFVANACGYTAGLPEGKYTRVHRDLSIINAMRSWVGLESTTAAALGIPGCS